MQHVGIRPGDKLEIELLPGGEFRGRALRRKTGSMQDAFGILKGKINGAKLAIEEINEAIAQAAAREAMESFNR